MTDKSSIQAAAPDTRPGNPSASSTDDGPVVPAPASTGTSIAEQGPQDLSQLRVKVATEAARAQQIFEATLLIDSGPMNPALIELNLMAHFASTFGYMLAEMIGERLAEVARGDLGEDALDDTFGQLQDIGFNGDDGRTADIADQVAAELERRFTRRTAEDVAALMVPVKFDADAIAQAIGDPGSVAGRRLGPSWGVGKDGYSPEQESVTRWSTRAVLKLLGEAAVLPQPAPTAAPMQPMDFGLDAEVTATITGRVMGKNKSGVVVEFLDPGGYPQRVAIRKAATTTFVAAAPPSDEEIAARQAAHWTVAERCHDQYGRARALLDMPYKDRLTAEQTARIDDARRLLTEHAGIDVSDVESNGLVAGQPSA
jgi:hypothetical protein